MNSSDNNAVSALILEIRDGSEDAFAQLVKIYTPMIHKAIRKLGMDIDAVFSDACMSLYKAALSYDFEKSDVTFGLYAKICVSRRMLDLFRKEGGDEKRITDFDVEEIAVDTDIVSGLVRKEQSKELHSCARQILSEFEYSVFLLWLSGLDTQGISDELNKGAKAIDNAKSRILKKLRFEFGKNGE